MPDQAPTSLPAGLYLVATPIGNARDITLRALDVLTAAEILVAEDTRVLRKLLAIHGVAIRDRKVQSYHDHSPDRIRSMILNAVKDGAAVAYTSDAGMPLIADPGFALVRDAVDMGLTVTSVPGPSAALTGLSISGLATDQFFFAGFIPSAKGARAKFLTDLANVPATLVLYVTPRRVLESLNQAATILGPDRRFAVCRELTKRFESVLRGRLGDAASVLADMPEKGECIVVIEYVPAEVNDADVESALTTALDTMSVKDAASHVASALGVARRDVYQRALELTRDK